LKLIAEVFALVAIRLVLGQHEKTMAACELKGDPGLPSAVSWMKLVLDDDYGDGNPNRSYLHKTTETLTQMVSWMIDHAQQMTASVIEQVPEVREAYERMLSQYVNTNPDIGVDEGSDDDDGFIDDGPDDDIVVPEDDSERVLFVAKSVDKLIERIYNKGPREQLTHLCNAIRNLGESPFDEVARTDVLKALDDMPDGCMFVRTTVNDWLAMLVS
jgi:hypothetical protein